MNLPQAQRKWTVALVVERGGCERRRMEDGPTVPEGVEHYSGSVMISCVSPAILRKFR